jgi:hypothetical protein
MLFDIWLREGEEQMDRRIGDHVVRLHAGNVYTIDTELSEDPDAGHVVPAIKGASGRSVTTSAGIGWRESKYKKALDLTQISRDRVKSWRMGKFARMMTKVEKKIKDVYGDAKFTELWKQGTKLGRQSGVEYVVNMYNDLCDNEADKFTEIPSLDPPTPKGVRAFAAVFKDEQLEQLENRTCKGNETSNVGGCGKLFDTSKQASAHQRSAHNPRKKKSNWIEGKAAPDGMKLHETVIDREGKEVV